MSRNRRVKLSERHPIGHALCAQRYFTPRPKAGLQARECRTSKINPASDLLVALAVCDEHGADVLELVHIIAGLTIKQDSLALLTSPWSSRR